MANPNLEMYRSDTLVEVGTLSSPIDFGLCNAGEVTELPYDILLYNDKGEILGSEDAKSISIELLRLILTQNETGDGSPNQQYTLSYIPVITGTEEITIDGDEWRRVTSFSGLGSTDEVYTFDYVTGVVTFGNGVEGKAPPISSSIIINYTPDLNTAGKEIYSNKWISVKSDGVIQSVIHIGNTTPELSTKVDDDTVQVLHYPEVTEIVGVWDNVSKTGTNYYSGGSFDADSGVISLGTSLTADDPYVEYKYRIKDDDEGSFTSLGDGVRHSFDNRIPRNNAKRLSLQATVPVSAGTEGGAYLKVVLRVYYSF